jgi:hypothetical protein
MENYVLANSIQVFCVAAPSFPAGIMESHQKLHELAPFTTGRKFFGLSRPENGAIVYKAAAEEQYEGEGAKNGCETLVIRQGNYISIVLYNFMQDALSIGNAFRQLLAQPGLDPEGYCVECYLSDKDVRCMVRLA